jgi:hypothetical protein
MKSLKAAVKPRSSVFDAQRRDTVLDLTNLAEGTIDPDEFFTENFVTEGMRVLLEQAFRRFEGRSDQGVFLLRQAMGGGKTHNLLTLGLLAKHPEYREKVIGSFYKHDTNLGPVKVIAFTGRETDAPYGIWGALAEQLGKFDHFRHLYQPLQAPGQTAWEKLFEGQTVLVLLDELKPYLIAARSKQIGNSDLAQVTQTAISNLLIAIQKEKCTRVCLVMTDLTGSYERGEEIVADILSDLTKESRRTAMSLEPVRLNSDEIYHILRTRLFESLPDEAAVVEVAQAYAKALRETRQMAITSDSPEQFAARVQASYPFHPGLRDLYARFRENEGFQQTRGLIRLMRMVVANLWNTGRAEPRYLIGAHDLGLNDRDILGEVDQINSTLKNAIAKDIADGGKAFAEVMDANLGGTDTQDVARLLLMSSLAGVPNAVVGLSIPEIIAFLAAPGRDVTRLKTEVLEKFSTAAWYLHGTTDGKLYFKNVENLIAKLERLVRNYLPEQAIKELRTRLDDLFSPARKWAYQRLAVLPAVDEIELSSDQITLVIYEPQQGTELRKELKDFYDQATWKNRIAFLTGSKNTFDQLIDTGKRLKAIQYIVDDLKSEKLSDNDPQMVKGRELHDRITHQFHAAVRESFTVMWYPFNSDLIKAEFTMNFEGNKYSGEQQILDLLKQRRKFEDLTEENFETFRKKCEQFIFTVQQMQWAEIKRRAASNPRWPWHHPSGLEDLKARCIHQEIWREDGGYVDKGPFPQPRTDVQIRELARDDNTGEVTLRITPVNGDVVYYDIGAEATEASAKLDGGTFATRETRVSFLAVDSNEVHEPGPAATWTNRISLKYRLYRNGEDRCVELRALPKGEIRYTTDGSSPKNCGASYEGDFVVPPGSTLVLAVAEADGLESEVLTIPLTGTDDGPPVDPKKPATWLRRHGCNSTKESYELLGRLKKYKAFPCGMGVSIYGDGGDKEWIEFNAADTKRIDPALLEESLEAIRKLQSGQVSFSAQAIYFEKGQDLIDWVAEVKTQLAAKEVKQ